MHSGDSVYIMGETPRTRLRHETRSRRLAYFENMKSPQVVISNTPSDQMNDADATMSPSVSTKRHLPHDLTYVSDTDILLSDEFGTMESSRIHEMVNSSTKHLSHVTQSNEVKREFDDKHKSDLIQSLDFTNLKMVLGKEKLNRLMRNIGASGDNEFAENETEVIVQKRCFESSNKEPQIELSGDKNRFDTGHPAVGASLNLQTHRADSAQPRPAYLSQSYMHNNWIESADIPNVDDHEGDVTNVKYCFSVDEIYARAEAMKSTFFERQTSSSSESTHVTEDQESKALPEEIEVQRAKVVDAQTRDDNVMAEEIECKQTEKMAIVKERFNTKPVLRRGNALVLQHYCNTCNSYDSYS